MFRKKGIIILYKTDDGRTGHCLVSSGFITRLISYATLFNKVYDKLKDKYNFTITNVIKL